MGTGTELELPGQSLALAIAQSRTHRPFLKSRLGRRKDHQQLEVLDDVDETVLGKLGYEGDRPGPYRLLLPLDLELGTPREHVVDLVLGVRRLMIGPPAERR
jgi:hypothetical protein